MPYIFKFLVGKKVIQLPVAPSAINIITKNQNRSVSLINGKEINVLSAPGLREIEFEAMFPRVNYQFATYKNYKNEGIKNTKYLSSAQSANGFLNELSNLKKKKKIFQFIIVRTAPGIKFAGTNIKVSLEDYTIKEDAENGVDVMVDIKLKEYKPYGTKSYKKKKKKKKK